MLWKNLTRVIANYAAKHPEHPGVRLIQAKASNMGKPLLAWLQQDYDIKAVGNLRQAIPEAFPKPLKKPNLFVGTNIHGAWQVLPVGTAKNQALPRTQ